MNKAALGATFVGLGAAIGIALQLSFGLAPLGGRSANDVPSCAAQDSAFLPAKAYGDFVRFLDDSNRLGSSRFDAGASGDWRGQGFFAALALEPRYRSDNEAIARSWGYEPLADRLRLPLSGSIVLENPGLLEAYQTISLFATAESATNRMNLERGAPQELVTPPEIGLIHADDVIVRQNKPAGPEYERRLGIVVRFGNLVMTLTFQGGADVTFVRVLPFVQDALSRVRAECGGESDA